MRRDLFAILATLVLCSASAGAQTIVHNDENLNSDRPEAWAMNYFAASTLMTGFGETPVLAPWRLSITADLGQIPRLSDSQERVGFNGVKYEDLNKSPVFGRLRLMAGLPGDFVAELGYTPPVGINGTRPGDLVDLALGRRLFEYERYTLSARVFAQHGRAGGDITCPAKLAGVVDFQQNPYGCLAPSDDQVKLNYYGGEMTAGWSAQSWHLHAGVGAARANLAVRVNAKLSFGIQDQSYLVANTTLPFATAGVSKDLDAHWNVGTEVLYVPLDVRRPPNTASQSDNFTSVRLQLRYRFD